MKKLIQIITLSIILFLIATSAFAGGYTHTKHHVKPPTTPHVTPPPVSPPSTPPPTVVTPTPSHSSSHIGGVIGNPNSYFDTGYWRCYTFTRICYRYTAPPTVISTPKPKSIDTRTPAEIYGK